MGKQEKLQHTTKAYINLELMPDDTTPSPESKAEWRRRPWKVDKLLN